MTVKLDIKKFMRDISKKSVIYILGAVGVLLLVMPSFEKKEEPVKEEEREDYCEEIEKRLEEILPDVAGVGSVSVMVTAENYGKINVAEDTDKDGSRIVKFGEKGGGEKPEIIEKIYPKIQGVIIAADGGGRSTVKESITEAVSALLGVESHKIKVFERKHEK